MNSSSLRIGINIDGALHRDSDPPLSLDEQFRLVSGHFDYFEKTLHVGEQLGQWLNAGERHGVPLGVLGGIFDPVEDVRRAGACIRLARDEAVGIVNCQVKPPVVQTPDDIETIGAFCLGLIDEAQGRVLVCLEPHVDMWLEHFDRVEALADWMHSRGAALHLTIDHSHLIYRVDNATELAAAGITSAHAGRRLLMPESPDAFYSRWMADGLIRHAHARCVQTNAPANTDCEREPGLPGRGIQYPLVFPSAGLQASDWDQRRCHTWNSALTDMLRWRETNSPHLLAGVSCEFIPYPDYGGGKRYSIIEQNLACASWLRETADRLNRAVAQPLT